MMHRDDVMHHTREEVVSYLHQALDIVDELGPPDDLRVVTFGKAAELLSGKQIMLKETGIGALPAAVLRQNG